MIFCETPGRLDGNPTSIIIGTEQLIMAGCLKKVFHFWLNVFFLWGERRRAEDQLGPKYFEAVWILDFMHT